MALAHVPPSHDLGALLPAWSALPFAGILLSIAVFPLLAPHFWHHHFPKVSAGWALLFAVPFVLRFGGEAVHELLHVAIVDYVPFLILIATLFTIGGGIHVAGSLRGTPATNAVLMVIGTVIASLVGTTGAAMIMIRPLLRANRDRHHRAHTVVFFIFLVANIGGGLTPLGDPPLFLGFLHGVPFFWTLGLWKQVLFSATIVLGLFLLHDLYYWSREPAEVRDAPSAAREPVRIEGAVNFALLAVVLVAVIASGVFPGRAVDVLGVHQTTGNLLRDAVMVAMLVASWRLTPQAVRAANEFSWGPIQEVAILFASIFVTIIPALAMLRVGEEGAMAFIVRAVREPAHFFWASGILSSFLDNAPTYLAFLSTALGRLFPGVPESEAVARLIREHPLFLVAVSNGSVFMGANTYIGNAPNFMVKSIAEEAGVPMPSFFGYIFRYSLPCLVTTFVLVTWIFFE
jgi:Na+/H+ antiporter NhaD/arsenite permease-like protein